MYSIILYLISRALSKVFEGFSRHETLIYVFVINTFVTQISIGDFIQINYKIFCPK